MNNGARLPFPRGLTASGGIQIASPIGGSLLSQLPTATGLLAQATPYRPDLAGIGPVETTDTVLGTGRAMKLRAVQAANDLTVARKCVTFSQTAKLFGFVTTDPAIPSSGTAGLVAKPIDPAYAVGTVIKKYDWFYVVEEGPASLLVGTSVTVQGSVMCDANGSAAPATATNYSVGTADVAVTADGSAVALVYVNAGTLKPEA